MKSTWFNNRAHYEFASILRETANDSWGRIFHDFLQCAAISLVQPVNKILRGEIDEKLEEDYLKTIKRHPKYATHFPKALAQMVIELEKDPHDFLGDVSAAMGMNDKDYRGQVFTPHALCEAMALMTIGDAKPTDFENNQMLLNEPACGGGAIMLATAKLLFSRGFFPWNFYYVASDIDSKCFYMTYLQASLMRIPATIMWQNTLTLETWATWTTFVGALHPMKKRSEEGILGTTPDKAVRVRTRVQK